jgi:hypothetical protein
MTLSEQIEADLPEFFSADDFASVATFTPISTGVPSTATVQLITELTAYGDSQYTRILGRYLDLKDLKKDDTVSLGGVIFGVVTSKSDELKQTMEVFLNE